MDQGDLFGLPLSVMLAFIALLLGLVLVARLLHDLRRPAVVRRGDRHDEMRRRSRERE